MSTWDMFKFWFIKEIGLPLVIFGLIILGVIVWAVVMEVRDKFRKKSNMACRVQRCVDALDAETTKANAGSSAPACSPRGRDILGWLAEYAKWWETQPDPWRSVALRQISHTRRRVEENAKITRARELTVDRSIVGKDMCG